MDLVGLAVAFLIQGPDKAAPATGVFNSRPTQVYVSNRQKNVEQLARGILQCYHPKAKYEVADMIEQPWRRQKQFGATRSAVFHIRYSSPEIGRAHV